MNLRRILRLLLILVTKFKEKKAEIKQEQAKIEQEQVAWMSSKEKEYQQKNKEYQQRLQTLANQICSRAKTLANEICSSEESADGDENVWSMSKKNVSKIKKHLDTTLKHYLDKGEQFQAALGDLKSRFNSYCRTAKENNPGNTKLHQKIESFRRIEAGRIQNQKKQHKKDMDTIKAKLEEVIKAFVDFVNSDEPDLKKRFEIIPPVFRDQFQRENNLENLQGQQLMSKIKQEFSKQWELVVEEVTEIKKRTSDFYSRKNAKLFQKVDKFGNDNGGRSN